MQFKHQFVDDIPERLEAKTLYVSLECGTVVHLCACGCGNESVTLLGRTDWSITYDGETISLLPSVGNWSFPCRSHYFITRDEIRWAPAWTDLEIEAGRLRDRALKDLAYGKAPPTAPTVAAPEKTEASLWRRVLTRLRSSCSVPGSGGSD